MTREGIKAAELAVLHDPTPETEVRQRQGPRKREHQGDCPKFGPCPQAHMMLDYIDARYVMDKLDHLGPENWQDRYIDRTGGSVRCGIGLLVDGEWVWKWDVGTVSDIEPEKGSYSEAFKRAAVKWGIGRDLYGHKATTSEATGSNKAAPPARPAPPRLPPRETAAPAADVPDEPEFLFTSPPDVHKWSEGDKHDPGHKPLVANARGLFCPTKLGDGTWCKWSERSA